MTHSLKTWPDYFKEVKNGNKNFELRLDDRPYTKGDTVILQEFNPETKSYTGEELEFEIGFILRGLPTLGLKKGYCIFTLKEKMFS